MVPPASHGIPRAPRYSGSCSLTCVFGYVALTLSGRPSHAVLLTLINAKCSPQPRKYFYSRFGLLRFRSPLLAESRLISFPRPTSMFQFRRFPSCTYFVQYRIHGHDSMWIAPFGYLRIKAHLRLPVAFRSLSRPSSAPGAKAFALRSL